MRFESGLELELELELRWLIDSQRGIGARGGGGSDGSEGWGAEHGLYVLCSA